MPNEQSPWLSTQVAKAGFTSDRKRLPCNSHLLPPPAEFYLMSGRVGQGIRKEFAAWVK